MQSCITDNKQTMQVKNPEKVLSYHGFNGGVSGVSGVQSHFHVKPNLVEVELGL